MKSLRYARSPWTTHCMVIVLLLISMSIPARGEQSTQAENVNSKLDSAPQRVQMVLYVPSDRSVPRRYRQGLGKIADYTDRFLQQQFKRLGIDSRQQTMFERERGQPSIAVVQGQRLAADSNHPSVHRDAIRAAVRQLKLPDPKKSLWWVFVYLGDPPHRFNDFRGGITPEFGGWAIANYDTRSVGIDLRGPLAGGVQDQVALKGMIHELGHAFGLPHIGSMSPAERGNTLMGPTNAIFRRATGKPDTRVHLSMASAAMLRWHPVFTERSKQKPKIPRLSYQSFQLTQQRPPNTPFAVQGQIQSDVPASHVIVANHHDQLPGPYWVRHYVSPVQKDGRFVVPIRDVPITGGELKVWFVFTNGQSTGDGIRPRKQGAASVAYRFEANRLRWDETAIRKPVQTTRPR